MRNMKIILLLLGCLVWTGQAVTPTTQAPFGLPPPPPPPAPATTGSNVVKAEFALTVDVSNATAEELQAYSVPDSTSTQTGTDPLAGLNSLFGPTGTGGTGFDMGNLMNDILAAPADGALGTPTGTMAGTLGGTPTGTLAGTPTGTATNDTLGAGLTATDLSNMLTGTDPLGMGTGAGAGTGVGAGVGTGAGAAIDNTIAGSGFPIIDQSLAGGLPSITPGGGLDLLGAGGAPGGIPSLGLGGPGGPGGLGGIMPGASFGNGLSALSGMGKRPRPSRQNAMDPMDMVLMMAAMDSNMGEALNIEPGMAMNMMLMKNMMKQGRRRQAKRKQSSATIMDILGGGTGMPSPMFPPMGGSGLSSLGFPSPTSPTGPTSMFSDLSSFLGPNPSLGSLSGTSPTGTSPTGSGPSAGGTASSTGMPNANELIASALNTGATSPMGASSPTLPSLDANMLSMFSGGPSSTGTNAPVSLSSPAGAAGSFPSFDMSMFGPLGR